MTVTKNIAQYIKNMGITLSELSRKSGVPYGSLYASLGDENMLRKWRGLISEQQSSGMTIKE